MRLCGLSLLSLSYRVGWDKEWERSRGRKEKEKGRETRLSEMFLLEHSKLSGFAVKFHEWDSGAKL